MIATLDLLVIGQIEELTPNDWKFVRKSWLVLYSDEYRPRTAYGRERRFTDGRTFGLLSESHQFRVPSILRPAFSW